LMNSAVIKPQAMKAPMFGITMFDSAVPSCCTRTRRLTRWGVSVVAVTVLDLRLTHREGDARHITVCYE
jgi:hypothetical protein